MQQLLKEKELLPKPDIGVKYFVVMIGDFKDKVLEIVEKLREKYNVDYDLSGRNIKNQMSYASSIKAKNVIFVGKDEVESGLLTVKNMKTGEQKKVGLDIL